MAVSTDIVVAGVVGVALLAVGGLATKQLLDIGDNLKEGLDDTLDKLGKGLKPVAGAIENTSRITGSGTTGIIDASTNFSKGVQGIDTQKRPNPQEVLTKRNINIGGFQAAENFAKQLEATRQGRVNEAIVRSAQNEQSSTFDFSKTPQIMPTNRFNTAGKIAGIISNALPGGNPSVVATNVKSLARDIF